MLRLLSAPGVVELEALVAKAGFALGATFGGLQLRRLAELAHDGRADVDGVAIALHHPFQRQVPEQAAQPPLAQVHVPLAGGAREKHALGVQETATLPTWVCAKTWSDKEEVHSIKPSLRIVAVRASMYRGSLSRNASPWGKAGKGC